MRVALRSFLSVVVLSWAGCEPLQTTDPLPLETSQQALINGTVTSGHLEIGTFGRQGKSTPTGAIQSWGCTGSLVAPRWVLTAAHCINYTTLLSSNCPYSYDVSCRHQGICPNDVQIGVSQVFNFGLVRPSAKACDDNVVAGKMGVLTGNLVDDSGNDDVALVLLKTPAPTSLVPHPASIAAQLPSLGQTVSGFGAGEYDVANDPDKQMRYADWAYNPTAGIHNTLPAIFAEGDSGGPIILGSGATDDGNDQVWGVNSKTGMLSATVTSLRPRICPAMYSAEPHSWGVLGAPLIVPVSGCQEFQSSQDAAIHTHEVISTVCASLPNCCDPTKSWDSSCVAAGNQVCTNIVNCQTGCFPAGTGNAWTFDKVGTTSQRYPVDFSVFAWQGNVSNIPDTYDAVAAGGNVVLDSFSINTLNEPVGLVAGGSLSLTHGTVSGSVFYGSSVPPTIDGVSTGTVTQGTPIKFAEAGNALTLMSATLSQAPNQIQVKPSPGTNLVLKSSDPWWNVFLIHQEDLKKTYFISLQVPSASTVIINVDGTAPTITGAGMDFVGHSPGLVLWNFYQAGSDPKQPSPQLVIKYVNFLGSILAPLADAQIVAGTVFGTLVARSLQDSWTEFYHSPFRNNCLVPN